MTWQVNDLVARCTKRIRSLPCDIPHTLCPLPPSCPPFNCPLPSLPLSPSACRCPQLPVALPPSLSGALTPAFPPAPHSQCQKQADATCSCQHDALWHQADQPAPHTRETDENEDPALNEHSSKGLLVRDLHTQQQQQGRQKGGNVHIHQVAKQVWYGGGKKCKWAAGCSTREGS